MMGEGKVLKKQLLLLVELQRVDFEQRNIENKKNRLPLELDRLQEELGRHEETVAEAKKRLEELVQRQHEKEKELARGVENLKKTKTRLFEVKTNKEYQALLTEMEVINQKNDVVESDIIVVLDSIDEERENVAAREGDFDARRSELENEIKKIQDEMDSIDALLADVTEKQRSLKMQIDAGFLKRYDLIKQKRNGTAVVPVWKEVCGGCHMNIPPQMYNQLQRSEELMLCPNCNRIMYWENRNEGEQ
jgi:predicted  nucleic acid-binding Zn-ribbon protein